MTDRIAVGRNAWQLTGLVIWVARLGICVLCVLSGCDRRGAAGALEGRWVGTVKTGDDWLLARVERDATFLAGLTRLTRARRPLFEPKVEERAFRSLLRELQETPRRP